MIFSLNICNRLARTLIVFLRRRKLKFVILYRQTLGFKTLLCTKAGWILQLARLSVIQQAEAVDYPPPKYPSIRIMLSLIHVNIFQTVLSSANHIKHNVTTLKTNRLILFEGKNRCLFWESQATQTQSVIFNIKAGGECCALDGWRERKRRCV